VDVMTFHPSAAASTTGPRWIIEQTQLARLPLTWQGRITAENGSVILADSPAAFQQNGANAEHYTTIGPCSSLDITINYVAKCLSLNDTPPPAGTYSLYDPEGWQLTPASEYVNQCKAMSQAAAIIKSAGATAIMAPSTPTKQWLVECAARAAAETDGQVMVSSSDQAMGNDV
jgi:hypothetical protein